MSNEFNTHAFLLSHTPPKKLNPQLKKERARIIQKDYCKKNKKIISLKASYKYHTKLRHDPNFKSYQRNYYNKNKEKFIMYQWKKRGVIGDLEQIYNRYKSTLKCEICNRLFDNETRSTQRCLDHSHTTGLVRNIVCCRCNCQIPKHT